MAVAVSEVDVAAVESALQEILCSQYFRGSLQCSSLLKYVVRNTLAERDECLRERVIGSEVFDRAPGYDTGNDHIVRSRASEVRKRLAQYYQSAGVSHGLRIGIPSGSYRATFATIPNISPDAVMPVDRAIDVQAQDAASEEAANIQAGPRMSATPGPEIAPAVLPVSGMKFSRKAMLLTTVLVVLACGCGALLARSWLAVPGDRYHQFWAPLNRSSKPAIIYCGGGFVYKVSDEYLDDYRRKHGLKDDRREFFMEFKPGESIPGQDLLPDRHFVPFGDLASTVRLVTTLSSFKKAYDLRYGDDLALTEFRTSPVILIGGLNNSWALKVTRNLRYVLDRDDRIVDQWHRDKAWTQIVDLENQARDDYAIISRLNSARNGMDGFVLSIAGIRMYGTRAGAELISDSARLNQVLKDLPTGWENRDLQIVIHAKTMNEIPVSVNVEAVYSW